MTNQLDLSARVVQLLPLRYAPSGMPVLDVVLEHDMATESSTKPVSISVKAIAFGVIAQTLSTQELDGTHRFVGHLGPSRNGKSILFHIQHLFKI